MSDETLSNLLQENRRFEPPADLAANANVKEDAYARADADREAFWAEQAERLDWDRKWDRVLDWDDPPFATPSSVSALAAWQTWSLRSA